MVIDNIPLHPAETAVQVRACWLLMQPLRPHLTSAACLWSKSPGSACPATAFSWLGRLARLPHPLLEQNDEWAVQRRYMTLETLSAASHNQHVINLHGLAT